MRGLHKIEGAKAAFIKAYCSIKINAEDKVKVNILVELASVCSEMPKSVWNVKRMIGDMPKGQGHLWACACYELASNSCWKKAAVAYYQFSYSVSKKQHLTWTLKPFSDLAMLKQHPWGLEMISYFLKCGCNRKTISLEHGDTYLHSVIRISLVVGNLTLLEYLVQQYCRQGNTDQHELDINHNSVLHAATKEKKVDKENRYDVIVLLLGCNVNPNLQNASGQLAIDYLPKKETQSREVLRMAMYSKENISKLAAPSETSRKQTQGRSQPLTEVKQTNAPTSKAKPKRSCDLCDDLLSQGIIHFGHEEPSEGYEKMVELLKQTHNGSRHEKVCEKAVAEIIKKLAETHNPEIPPCLMSVGRETYLMIVDGLASSNKWRQLDMLVRKFRNMHGSDQLKGFASNLSVVPVVSDTSLKAAEEVKLQIVSNLLNCGATLGSDNGETAVKSAVSEEHFKVLTELVKRGADTTKLSMYDGDTPIHAAMVIVLEKEKSPVLLDFLLDQFESNPGAYPHLDPEQLDQNGNCLFHLIARAKFSTHVLKLTEMLCKKNLSANYFNKEGKLPINYLTKKNDRRLQYLRLARSVAPSREQLHGPNVQRKDDSTASLDEDLHQKQRPADSETNHQVVIDVARAVSLRDQRKKHIEELIRLLPDSKHSIFKVDQTPSGKPVIETERNDKHTEQENMDKENPMENRHTGAKELSNSDRSISKIDNQSSETLVEDSKQVAETYKWAHRKEMSDPLKQENTLGDKTDSISSESKRFEVKDAEPGIRNTDTRHLLLERDRNKTNKKDNAEMNVSIEEFVDELSELDSSVTTTEDVDVDLKHEESNDLNGQSNLKHQDKQDNKSKKKEKSCFELKDVELIDRVNVIEEGTEEKVMEEETDKVEAEVQADIEAVERVVRVETNNVDNEDEGIDRKVNEMESVDESDYEDEEEPADDYVIDIQVFDNLEWEVECTAEVWKTLRDKHVIPELKRRIVRNIQLLASGDWQPHLCKKLKHVPATLNLFEAKFSKGRRILWELAVAFSPRCSETAERRLQAKSGELTQAVRGGRIYSEIIRVWDIVLDHDKIHRCVQRIKKSHQRGEECIIQKKLRGMKDNPQVPLGTCKRYPMLYAEEDIPDSELEQHHQDMQRFFPPASSNDTEYHILKFYSFSSTLVSHVLQSIDTKVDFPFRVTDLEHAIINIKSKAPILLLGRSGTGKTTCCLYRLWSQFHAYWLKAKEADAPLLPRCAEFVHQEVEVIISDDEQEVSEEDINEENNDNDECEVEGASGGGAAAGSDTGEMEIAAGQGDIYDHLHQLFITKNAVLSSEVQKNFRELSHADDSMREHVQHEEELLPSRLQDVRDYHYPLFLTSRQLLLMLDASLGPPFFFERKEDGSLKVDIAGWTDLDGPLSFLPLLDEDSDAEDDLEQYVEDDEEDEMAGQGQTTSGKKLKVDPRREITYGVFVEEIWPRIKKKMSGYHPSLVWMEIMSFIKGSFEALSKPNGHLNKEEYFKLGRKRAPNFSGERDTIYQFFLRYEHFKKQISLFDETDLVHNAFLRLRNVESWTWVIHQIFVDETQDFTQAELGLLIRICQNPNDMFLTGDTAQSIMRGISFRFSDLRSLFYHAKQSMQAMGKTSAVEVPKQVYQLTHNYRSHAGILSLATSVLELLVEFFPESFDRLQPDQGLFHGPRPILLESCSFSDLAVLLRGNRRKTSHIEFGAHQAILVVNDAARDSIPEELRLGLVLTIYEAKGLEFDDVLLYNFFKDSQAMKEWRVVTEYLERLAAQQNVEQETKDNLIQLDHDVLDSAGRPRPLNFDANQHKVLNSELKHLYTALTRARVNVWVFDEDMDKRAPMFEYFKARKLVKCMHVEEINETSLSETMFAEKSSAADWLRRGEDFMRHSLYGVAAKCFGIGGDKEREKIALAHGQALKASRLKDNPREMKEEFLHAAELYMECNRPSKAALCLQNAKERELAAQLLEKLGQYERAAEMYIRLKRPMSSSECYEQLGNYHRAVEVLYENELYDQAIDTLRRYQLIIKDLEQKGKPIPQQMIDHKPVAYTEEKLSHRSAEMFHKYKNEERMLASVDRFQNIVDKVEFLKRKNYIPQAAKILEDDGQLENAAYLLLMCGRFDEAIEIAKKSLKVDVIAQSLLVTCRAILSKKDKIEQNRKLLNEGLMDALEMSRGCNDEDMTGQIYLLQAEFTGELDHIKKAWGRFLHSKSFPNAAGLVECTDFLMKIGHMSTYEELQITVKGLDYMFSVCQALLNPNTQTNREKVLKYDQMYGLEPHTQDKLIIHPKEKPLCLNMLQTVFKSKSEREKRVVEVSKTETYENIVLFLLERGRGWLKPIKLALNQMRDATRVCDYFQAGLECPNEGNVDRPCIMMHTPQTDASFKMLINMDLLMIEYEANCNDGAANLKKKSPRKVRDVLEDYLCVETADPSIKYHACETLWNDLMPTAGHPLLVGNQSKALLEYVRRQDKVIVHFKKFLQEKWKLFTDGDMKLRSSAARETEVYLLYKFGYHLFGLDTGKRKFDRSPSEEMTQLERLFDNEIASLSSVKKKSYYTLMMSHDKQGYGDNVIVTCVARRFYDAYELISNKQPDPLEAVVKFSKFQIQLSTRSHTDYNFYPDLKHYIMWLEFFTCVSIFLIAKLKSKNFQDFMFILPNNYFALIHFIQATFPSSGYSVFETVGYWAPSYHKQMHSENLLVERLKGFSFVVSGHAQGIRILDKIVQSCKEDPSNYALLERLLILNMTLVCNVGKAVPPESESSLMSSMCHINLHSPPSARLQQVLETVKTCKGTSDVATLLGVLLQQRGLGEEMQVCWWAPRKKASIEKTALKNMSLFSQTFINERTLDNMHETKPYREQITVKEIVVEADLDEDEIESGLRDKETQLQEEKLLTAVLLVQRSWRAKLIVRKLRKEKANKTSQRTEADSMFEDIKVDDKMCGICGVFFNDKLEAKLELEKSVFVGGSSVLNTSHAESAVWGGQQVSDEGKRNQWSTTQENTLDKPELREKLLQNIRSEHVQELRHIQKASELQSFKSKYRQHIAPKLRDINSFLYNPVFNLTDYNNVEKNFGREYMAIDRMFRKGKLVEKEIQLLLKSRMWSVTAGLVEQKVMELEDDFKTVKPYVEEVHLKLEQEEEEKAKQVSASASAMSAHAENWDDELEDIKPVVEEPTPRRKQIFRNRRGRGKNYH